MKTILILLFSLSCFAQQRQPFVYSYVVNNSGLHVVFANSQYPWSTRIEPSMDVLGTFTLDCRQDYIELIVKLLTYGNSLHATIANTQIGSIHIYIQMNHAFVLIVDDQNRVWKLTKPEALLLASTLYHSELFNQLIVCGCN